MFEFLNVSSLLCTISNMHIKNSGNLLNKINNLNMENKSLASLDIISLYTNIPMKKMYQTFRNSPQENKHIYSGFENKLKKGKRNLPGVIFLVLIVSVKTKEQWEGVTTNKLIRNRVE